MELLQALLLFGGLSLLIVAGQCIYDLYFHPLANIPGPALARVSRLWLFFEEMKGDAHNTILRLHRSHGKLVRITPDEVSVNDHETFSEIYKQGTRFLKAPYWYRAFALDNDTDNIFTIIAREKHSAAKRLMSHAFSKAAILDHEELIYSKAVPMMKQIESNIRQDKLVPLFPAIRRLTLDMITAFCFGNTPEDRVDPEPFSSPVFQTFDDVAGTAVVFQHFPVVHWLVGALGPYFPNPSLAAFDSVMKESTRKLRGLRAALQNGQAGFSLFHTMLENAKSQDQALSDKTVVAEGMVMLVAGTDTTSSTIALGLYHLLQRPELYRRLQKDLLALMPDVAAKPSYAQLEQLPLLNACVKEGLRLACAIRGRLPRVVPPEGWEVDGVYLAPGTIIGTAPLYQCFDERIFPEPHAYRPERWLSEGSRELETYLQPFSRGTRQCIGQNLSLVEQRIVLSQFVRRFSPASNATYVQPELKEFASLKIMSDLDVRLELCQM